MLPCSFSTAPSMKCVLSSMDLHESNVVCAARCASGTKNSGRSAPVLAGSLYFAFRTIPTISKVLLYRGRSSPKCEPSGSSPGLKKRFTKASLTTAIFCVVAVSCSVMSAREGWLARASPDSPDSHGPRKSRSAHSCWACRVPGG